MLRRKHEPSRVVFVAIIPDGLVLLHRDNVRRENAVAPVAEPLGALVGGLLDGGQGVLEEHEEEREIGICALRLDEDELSRVVDGDSDAAFIEDGGWLIGVHLV